MKTMRVWATARRFGIGALMIGSLSALLLYSDRDHGQARAPTRIAAKMYRIGIAYFAPEEGNDLCIQGLLAGLRSEGFVEGQNLEVLKSHAQAESGNIPSMIQNFEPQV